MSTRSLRPEVQLWVTPTCQGRLKRRSERRGPDVQEDRCEDSSAPGGPRTQATRGDPDTEQPICASHDLDACRHCKGRRITSDQSLPVCRIPVLRS
ncbi:hypothetical protein CB1_000372019 [Camelus ferus]|nr:hypothetical protein CB1_000372019 [Camelus ferus]